MSELAPLISDLALILICAGVMTLIFKRLKQPLVLGYIVAGFLASPHFALTPSVIDTASIHTWSEIGVIFLLSADQIYSFTDSRGRLSLQEINSPHRRGELCSPAVSLLFG